MAVTITATGLVAVYPEWEYANTNTPDVVQQAVDQANDRAFTQYTSTVDETNRRYLEASAILYLRAYARDMKKPEDGSLNPYRAEANRLDRLRGAAERAPGWTLPVGVT